MPPKTVFLLCQDKIDKFPRTAARYLSKQLKTQECSRQWQHYCFLFFARKTAIWFQFIDNNDCVAEISANAIDNGQQIKTW